MSQKLNSWSGIPFIDASGDPYSGAKLFVYVAGSSTKQTTTKDLAGVSSHANPIILNSSGVIADGAGAAQEMWQPEGTAVKLVLAPSTDSDPPVAAIREFDNIAGINDASIALSEWITAQTPTFVSATTFTVAGDHTSTYHFGRRVKMTQTSGTEYGTIVSSAYTSLTTITVAVDGGVSIDSGLSQVDVGLLTATNEAIPNTTSLMQRWSKGADIASASALALGIDGNYFDVTGTTTITSIVTSGKVGTEVTLHFDGIVTLTHDATNLVIPSGANHDTAAGDEYTFKEYASGDWRMVSYVLASGKAIVATDLRFIQRVDGTPYTTYNATATAIPVDDTIPQNTEGTEYVTVAITPTNASNILVIRGDGSYISASGALTVTAALFQDSTAGALKAASEYHTQSNEGRLLSIEHRMVAGTASETTFKMRIGPSSGTAYVNGSTTTRLHGGVNSITLSVEEIAV